MDNNIQIVKLPPGRWEEYRDLWLEVLKSDPTAFLTSDEF
ncbi:MAG: hypothetical protein UY21_C0009G0043 [Microgenomates group bacterium GW2011_GWA1_48_10]|nr:MAG: hypothetical protein UY21_C0009G0043 [Microgenomates group bacterium GW2011_GWA1_48_10]